MTAEPLSRLSVLLEDRSPTYEEARDIAEKQGVEIANAYNAGYWRAVRTLKELEGNSAAT